MPARFLLATLIFASVLSAAPKRVLYVTHSAGFRHDSIIVSRQVLANQPAGLDVVATEDLSQISADNLRNFDVVFFFTSGELALSDSQKNGLLSFVRGGKGFGGVHSATDTLYNWPEYGDLIGAYFDEHPWAREVTIDIEDPDHPATRHLAPSFRITDEIYQFRSFSRDRVRVLMTLDTRTVDLNAPSVHRRDGDFALAWCRNYGQGRVFYTALGHADSTWLDRRFQTMITNALLWLAAEVPGDATPRSATPAVHQGGVVSAASFTAPMAPGSLISVFGQNLTSGSTLQFASAPLPVKLAGTMVLVNGAPVPLLYASPTQVNAQLPFNLAQGEANIAVATVDRAGPPQPVRIEAAAPGIFAILGNGRRAGDNISIYATGLGAVRPPVVAGEAAPLMPLSETVLQPEVSIGGMRAQVRFSGLAPLYAGLYQVDAIIPAGLPPGPTLVTLQVDGRTSNAGMFTLAQF